MACSGTRAHLRHAVFESGHDYNKAMREAAYGWFALHLAGRGDGSPIAEPAIQTEDPEALRCFPGDSRPDDFMTLPRYAAAEGRRLTERKAVPSDPAAWKAEAERRRAALVTALGGFPDAPRVPPQTEVDGRAPGRPVRAGAGRCASRPGSSRARRPMRPGSSCSTSTAARRRPRARWPPRCVRTAGRS